MSELWVFKYAPKSLNEYICTQEFKEKLQKIIDEVPNCLLYGNPGTGKGAFVDILIKTTGYDVLKINASDESGINAIRDKVKPFSMIASFNDYKIVYLNEADRLSSDAQQMLRDLMEEVQATTRFVYVINDISAMHDAILSRCQLISFNNPPAADIAKLCFEIIKKEDIKVEGDNVKKELVALIKHLYPDIRRILNSIQGSVVNNTIKSIDNTSEAVLKEIVDGTIVGDFETVRTTLRNTNVRYSELYDRLFERVDEFKGIGDAVIHIGDSVYRDKFVANKEINYLTMLCKLMKSGCIK